MTSCSLRTFTCIGQWAVAELADCSRRWTCLVDGQNGRELNNCVSNFTGRRCSPRFHFLCPLFRGNVFVSTDTGCRNVCSLTNRVCVGSWFWRSASASFDFSTDMWPPNSPRKPRRLRRWCWPAFQLLWFQSTFSSWVTWKIPRDSSDHGLRTPTYVKMCKTLSSTPTTVS